MYKVVAFYIKEEITHHESILSVMNLAQIIYYSHKQ